MRPPDISLPLGVVISVASGPTRWARFSRKAVAVLPGAGPAKWQELRREGDTLEYHAATLPLELWRTDTDAYRVALSARTPSVGVIMRENEDGLDVLLVTASPYVTQDYLDSGEEIVDLVAMPPMVVALIRDFIAEHHAEVPFVKRRRDRARIDLHQEGIGDARIRQPADVYRSPDSRRRSVL